MLVITRDVRLGSDDIIGQLPYFRTFPANSSVKSARIAVGCAEGAWG